MNWPFVSRDFLASAEARCKAEHENAMAVRHALIREEARADNERAERLVDRDLSEKRYQELLIRYHALKLQGAVEPVPPPPVKIATIDPILRAVNERAPDQKTRDAMMAQVRIDTAAGLKVDEIVRRIYRGNRPAEETA